MAYNNKNYLEKIKQAVEVTKAHYEPGRQDRNHRWVWNNYIFKFRKYSNNVIKKAKEFDNSMIITILMSPDKRYSTL